MYTTHEGKQVLGLVREMAYSVAERQRIALRTRLHAGQYSARWLKKQRKDEAAARSRFVQARNDLHAMKSRMLATDWATCRSYFFACKSELEWRPGTDLRYVRGWGPIARITLRDSPTLHVCANA